MAKAKELQTVVSISGKLDKSVQKAVKNTQKKLEGLNKKVAAFEKVTLAAGAALTGALAGAATFAVKKLYDLGEEFQQVQNTIRIGTGATGKDLKELEQVFDNLYTTLPLSKDVVSKAVADINTLTGATGKDLETFAHRALDAADMLGEDAEAMYTAAAQSMNAFGISTADMADKLDYVWKAAQTTGVSMTDLMNTAKDNEATFQQLGYSYEQSVALIGQMSKAGFETSSAMSALKKAVANMAKEGVKDLSKGLENAFNNIKKAKDETTAASIAAEAFGTKAGPIMAKGIRDGTIAVDDLVASLQASGETIDKAADDTDTMADKWTEFKHHIEVGLRPAVDAIYSSFKQFIPVLDDIATRAMPYVQQAARKLADYMAAMTDKVKAWAQSYDFETLKGKLVEFVEKIKDCARWVQDNSDKLLTLGKVLLGVYAAIKVLQVGFAIFKGIATAIHAVNMVVKAGQAIWTAGKAAVLAFKSAQIGAKIATIASTVATKAAAAAQWLFNAALTANPIGLVIAAIAALVAAAWALYKNWDTICAWLGEKWNQFKDAFPQTAAFLTNAWNAVCNTFKTAFGLVKDYISMVFENIKVIFTTIGAVISEAWQAVCSLLKGDFDGFFEHVRAIGDAIETAFCTVWTNIKNFVKGVIDAIMGFLQPIIDAVSRIGDALKGIKDKAANVMNGLKESKLNPANWFAAGGFTNGPSICGEAGTEAVISFDPAYRKENQGYLMTAAEMLGMTATPDSNRGNSSTVYNLGGITFSPVIKTGDSASRSDLLAQLRACVPEVVDMIETALKEREGHRYA